MAGKTVEVVNDGVIAGTKIAVVLDGPGSFLLNNHVVQGDVIGGTGPQTVANTGVIYGDVLLGDANDTYYGSGFVQGIVAGQAGRDTMSGHEGEDRFFGGRHADTLSGHGGNDILDGGLGTDTLFGGAGDDTLRGGGAGDRLFGGAGADTLTGNAGADWLNGGAGDDVLTGDGGKDVFVFNRHAGTDWITDFVDGDDRIDLSAFGLISADFAFGVQSSLSPIGNETILIDLSTLGGSGTVRVDGLSLATTDVTDFIF